MKQKMKGAEGNGVSEVKLSLSLLWPGGGDCVPSPQLRKYISCDSET